MPKLTYQTAIISDMKKHYIGWTGRQGAEPDIVGMEADKNLLLIDVYPLLQIFECHYYVYYLQ